MNYETKIQKSKQELERMQNSPIQMSFIVKTMIDERVCSECSKHEGIKYDDVLKARIGENYPPFHDGCRCFASHRIVGIRNAKKAK